MATDLNSFIALGGITVNGGTLTTNTLNTVTAGVIENNGTATVNGVTISTGSTLTLLNNTTTVLMGTITNKRHDCAKLGRQPHRHRYQWGRQSWRRRRSDDVQYRCQSHSQPQ